MKTLKIDEYSTVIVRVRSGVIADYYTPKNIHLIIVDEDAIDEAGEATDELILAASRFLDNYNNE